MKKDTSPLTDPIDPHTVVQRLIYGGPALTVTQLEALTLLCALAMKALHRKAFGQRMDEATRKELRAAVDEARNAG